MNAPTTFDADGLQTSNNADFLQDARFRAAYDVAIAAYPRGAIDVRWRAHVALWAAAQGLRLDGDFVECGVHTGILSKLIYEYFQFDETGRRFWLCDTFEGLVPELISDAEREAGRDYARINARHYATPYLDVVRERFGGYRGARIIAGAVPSTLDQVQTEKVAYLSIDMNSVGPEIAAGEHFWPKLVSGAVVVLDDYGFFGHDEQKQAWDAFAAQRGVMILSSPTGQGLMIKP